MRLVPATASRTWMAETRGGFPHRCLPLLVANQAGWFVLNSQRVVAIWTGGNDHSALKVFYQDMFAPKPAESHFGYGILTWRIPYLFRTPPDYNLLARGPANWPKDGAYPLEGLVETDWSEATFTMNWKLTRPNAAVIFEANEPICMIVPQRRGELESFYPRIRSISTDPQLHRGFEQWSESRAQFNVERKAANTQGIDIGWQRHYFKGTAVSGTRAPGHQTKLKLRSFAHVSADETDKADEDISQADPR